MKTRAGEESAVPVAAEKQSNSLPVLQSHDPPCGQQELVGGDLEQFIAGKRLQDVDQGLRVVSSPRQSAGFEHSGNLAPEEGYPCRAGAVGGRCQEAEESALSHYHAVRIEATHADVVHVDGPMYP